MTFWPGPNDDQCLEHLSSLEVWQEPWCESSGSLLWDSNEWYFVFVFVFMGKMNQTLKLTDLSCIQVADSILIVNNV